MTNAVETHFAKTVSDYDTVVDSVVIKNEELHRQLVAGIDRPSAQALSVLDIGCGTGHAMSLVLGKYANAFITGVDSSARMLEKAHHNLAAYAGRYELSEADIVDYETTQKFDVVISAVTLHNLPAENKEQTFRKIRAWLKPGGRFVNGDFFRGETEENDNALHAAYIQYVKSKLSGDELEVWLRHIEQDDDPARLSEQFQILRELGFDEPVLLWTFGNEAVYRVCLE